MMMMMMTMMMNIDASYRLQVYWENNCYNIKATDTPWTTSYCRSAALNSHITVDIPDFEVALVNALVHVGTNISLYNQWPVRDPTTVTGWK